MIARMQQRLDQLGSATAERDQALQFLEKQIDQAAGEIAGTGKTNESLRGETAVLSDQINGLSRDRERLAGEAGEHAAAQAALETQVTTLSGALDQAHRDRSLIEQELAAARSELAQSVAGKNSLQAQVAGMAQKASEAAKTADTRLAAAVAEAGQRAAEADRLRAQVAELQQAATERTAAAAAAAADVTKEAAETERLRREIDHLNEMLATAETKVDTQQDTITGLDAKLDEALARKVEELEQYRSEFFGRLKQALGDRPDLRVVGDRFVFQSELLFASGSASLDPAGQAELRQLAVTLEEVAARIPPGVDWILRVDGHTDRQPIRDGSFHSNWELSAARAISVIEFLTAQGIAPEHLAAAGFGEYRPIDPGDDEIAYRRNRRIEFKLTEG